MNIVTLNWLLWPRWAATGLLGALALVAPAMAAKPFVHDGECYFLGRQYKAAGRPNKSPVG